MAIPNPCSTSTQYKWYLVRWPTGITIWELKLIQDLCIGMSDNVSCQVNITRTVTGWMDPEYIQNQREWNHCSPLEDIFPQAAGLLLHLWSADSVKITADF